GKKMKNSKVLPSLALLFAVAAPLSGYATYNANLLGTVTYVMTYPNGQMLLILNNQPTSNGPCTAGYFELDPPTIAGADVVNDAAFNRMYARALAAFASGVPVNIGYDNAGTCGANGYIRIYRIG